MVDKIEKALTKLTKKEREVIRNVLTKIQNEKIKNLDLKKLKGYDGIFRVRKGEVRLIFQKKDENIIILSIERRSDKTYKNIICL